MIDFTYFNECFDGNDTLKKEVIRLFLEQSEENLNELQYSLDANQYETTAQIAHYLISSAITMGIPVVDTLRTLENNAKTQNNLGQLHALVAEVSTQYRLASVAYKELLNSLEH